MRTVLFWDIDGTLLTTARAGVRAWEAALAELIGRPADLRDFRTAGLTDIEIARLLAESHDIRPIPERVEAMLRTYERLLPDALPSRVGLVLPNVRQILLALEERHDVQSLLLTGNTRAGARAKLRHYGLDRFFEEGAFCDGLTDRPSIARRALTLIGPGPTDSPDRLYLIGDTPHDVKCGEAIGARVVAVATGDYTCAELREHHPWWCLDHLPESRAFLRKLGLESEAESAWNP